MWTVHGVAPKKPSQPIRKVIVQSRFNAILHEGDQSSSNQHPLDASQANKNKKDNPCCKGRESPVEVKKEDEESTVCEKPTTTSGMLAAWLLKDTYLQTHLQKCLKQYFYVTNLAGGKKNWVDLCYGEWVSEYEHTLKPINDLVAPALSLITVNIPNDSLLEINKEVRNLPVIKEEDIKDEPPEEKVKINDETKDAVFEIKHEVSDDWNVFSL